MATATTEANNPLRVRLSPYWRWSPQAAQYVFLSLPHLEALYGGAAGGGKSIALLMAALQYVDIPGYDALLVRRTYQQLAQPGSLMQVAREWMRGTDANWNDTDKRFTFPSGATLSFGYLSSERDLDNYQGPSYSFIGFDELTQFPERHFKYLFSRLRRSADSPVPVRMRAASNPGNRGHSWVKQRYLEEGAANGRMFVPARLSDNPGLDQEGYVRSLSELDPFTRKQLLEGDWDAKPAGAMFDRVWFADIVDELPAMHTLRFVRYWDQAATQPTENNPDPDYTVGLLLAVDHEGTYYVCDVRRFRDRPGAIATKIRRRARKDGPEVPIVFEQEPGASGKLMLHEWQQRLPLHAVRGQRVQRDKVTRAAPVAARAERGDFKLLRGPWISEFLDELDQFPEVDHDDQVDALSGAYAVLATGSQTERTESAGRTMTSGLLTRNF